MDEWMKRIPMAAGPAWAAASVEQPPGGSRRSSRISLPLQIDTQDAEGWFPWIAQDAVVAREILRWRFKELRIGILSG